MDKRTKRTRESIFEAFQSLVFSTPFNEIKIQQVIEGSGVARSTFYANFRDKNDLLLQSLNPMISVLRDAAIGACRAQDLQVVLDHFWQHRQIGRIIFQHPTDKLIAQELAEMIAGKVDAELKVELGYARVMANYLAAGQLAVVKAWLAGNYSMSSTQIAEWLVSISRGNKHIEVSRVFDHPD